VLCATLRIQIRNAEEVRKLQAERKKYIVAFWHGTMLLPWFTHRGQQMIGLTSQSKDGELLARVLQKWGYMVIRGSSSKGGKSALDDIVSALTNEGAVLLTPDGPRGPAREFKPGAVVAAMRAGVPLFLLGVGYERKKKLRSWDQFEIPFPFSRVNVGYSDAIAIRADASREEVSGIIEACGAQLNQLQEEADRF
jgi:lysophospholipid acyltransferase (LPLAT)-like uncharacterized protein